MSIQEKIEKLIKTFTNCTSTEEKYHKIIFFGEKYPKMSQEKKNKKNLVKGCQSKTYVSTHMKEGKIFFEASSDALISQGLAAILIYVYNQETPEVILKHEPNFLKELKLQESLSMNRSNGLMQILYHMKKEVLQIHIKNHQ